MARRFSLIMVFALLLSSFMLLSGCSNADEGLKYYELTDASLYQFMEDYEGPDDAYLCVVEEYAEAELTVPSTYKGKPVVAVSSGTNNMSQANVKELILSEGIMYVDSGFSGYKNLTSVSFPSSLVGVYTSFNGCNSLKSLEFPGNVTIKYSFSRCSNLESIVYRGSSNEISDDSYLADPKLPGSPDYAPDGGTATETTRVTEPEMNEYDYNMLMEEVQSTGSDWAEGIMERAIAALVDSGDVSGTTLDGKKMFAFDGDNGAAFTGDEARDRYTSDFERDGAVICGKYYYSDDSFLFSLYLRPFNADPDLSDYDFIDVSTNSCVDSFAGTTDECRYLIVVMGVVSDVDEEFYMGGIDRETVSTEVLIIDVDSEEIVHIEHIGVSRPGTTAQRPVGNMLEADALEYVRTVCSQ
ncbi:MAG: leucine-rich repeat domain-containing protein [Clostridiales bacterium]|nr:leucine-rich repeat domain-containing protein [Clostridiales bacterium]